MNNRGDIRMTEPRKADSSGNLALIFQEALTATVRLRASRQRVDDAESFRANILALLQTAEQQSRTAGYSEKVFRIALEAVVGFLDESILNSRNPSFNDWPRRPLTEQIFHHNKPGEVFFENLNQLLTQPDAPVLADILEVYCLCLLLGFSGRYVGSKGELRALREAAAEKIRRIRGYDPMFAPDWAPPAKAPVRPQQDPWGRALAYLAAACLVLTLVLFIGFKLALNSDASQIRSVAATIRDRPVNR
jgi:type VI secretion system protein ImpK